MIFHLEKVKSTDSFLQHECRIKEETEDSCISGSCTRVAVIKPENTGKLGKVIKFEKEYDKSGSSMELRKIFRIFSPVVID